MLAMDRRLEVGNPPFSTTPTILAYIVQTEANGLELGM